MVSIMHSPPRVNVYHSFLACVHLPAFHACSCISVSWYKLHVQNPQHVFNISGMDPSACPACLSLSACCFHNVYQSVLRVFVCLPSMPASTCVGLKQTECPQSPASLLAYASSLLSPGQCVHPVRREFRKETEKQTNKKW